MTENQYRLLDLVALAEKNDDYIDIRRLTDFRTLRTLERRGLIENRTDEVDHGTYMALTQEGRILLGIGEA